ncbi:hypothetical protein J7E88_26825 [Streptomyces sp. ISL-10]|uniref:hypothetical protein n=1 Tax=Streptomyces sp. ISL-10 TaxID=2819172 RepID=UPI001BEB8FA2|nr:hypothetical protein [Streptomyces sp. ISL-10]MBT2368844.1 hypothetical protein [Streptomyces sp. ISL-10]
MEAATACAPAAGTTAAAAVTAPAEAQSGKAAVPCRAFPIPPASALSYEAYAGCACYACAKPLTTGAVLVGRAHGMQGAHDLGTDVYACL